MASLVAENVLEGIEIQEILIDGAFLMSMLEESSQGEGREDEERLKKVFESLQEEIANPISMCDDDDLYGSTMEPTVACQEEEGYGQEVCDWSVRQDELDFSWVDDMEMVPSSPSEDMNWYMDNYGNEMDVGLAEFGLVADYSQICNGSIDLEGSLWQESYDTVMYS